MINIDIEKDVKIFKMYFKENLMTFIDKMIFCATGRKTFDIILFESWLVKKHGYDENKCSIAKFLEDNFSKDCRDFVNRLLI